MIEERIKLAKDLDAATKRGENLGLNDEEAARYDALATGARAKIRVLVKRILNRHGYPPDLQDEAVQTVLKQAELLCADWV